MEKQRILKEIERLQEVLAFIRLYEGNRANFEDAYRLLKSERTLYPDHTTSYGNDIRQSDKKQAWHYMQVREGGGETAEISYNQFIEAFTIDVSSEITGLELKAGRLS